MNLRLVKADAWVWMWSGLRATTEFKREKTTTNKLQFITAEAAGGVLSKKRNIAFSIIMVTKSNQIAEDDRQSFVDCRIS